VATSKLYARLQRQRRRATETPAPRMTGRSAGGDEQRLRLIPVIGRGCGGGATPGSRPTDIIRGRTTSEERW
jgi:hypothetical protein